MRRTYRICPSVLSMGLLLPAIAHAEAPPAAPPPTAAAPAPTAAPVAAPAPTPAAAPAPAAPAPVAAPAPAAPAVAPTTPPAAAPAAATPAPAATAPAVAPTTTAAASVAATASVAPDGAAVVPPAQPTVVTPPLRDVPFNIGLFPPLSINGSHRGQNIRNNISLAAGWSQVHTLDGAAAAFGATVVEDNANGITWALGASMTKGTHTGIQVAHGYNHATRLEGIQAGMVNYAGEARGAQAGLLNITRGSVRGVQVGLVNYADEADASFALLPITKKGGIRPEVWTSDTAALNVGIRLPAKYTYAFFAGGIHPFAQREREVVIQTNSRGRGTALLAGMGYGAHIPVTERVGIDGDLSGWVVTEGLRTDLGAAAMGKLRAMVAWQIRPRIAVWGGPTLNVMVNHRSIVMPRPGYGWVSGGTTEDEVRVRWWPGFAAGLRF